MTLYAKIENDQVVGTFSEYAIRQNNPNTTFPEVFTAPDGYLPLVVDTIPDYDKNLQTYKAATITIDGDHCTQRWIVVDAEIDMATAKADRLGQLKAIRDKKEAGGINYLGKRFDTTILSVMRMSLAAQAAKDDPSYTVTWITADNSYFDMNADQVIGLHSAVAAASKQIFAYAISLRDKINAATTGTELYAIDVTTGWPDV